MMKYIFRLIALPFFAMFILVHLLKLFLTDVYCFIRYGGEWIQYSTEMRKDTVHGIVKAGLDYRGTTEEAVQDLKEWLHE